MNWTDIWKIALACIASAGGIGGVILVIIKFSSNIIADRLSKKYDLKMQKALEGYKTDLSRKEFISKTRFEAEFRIYQELSEKNTSLAYCAGEALTIVWSASLTTSEIQEYYNKFRNQIKATQQINRRYAPFINEHIYDQFLSLEKKADKMCSIYKVWLTYQMAERNNKNPPVSLYDNYSEIQNDLQILQKELFDALNVLLCDLRVYLKKLDVLELHRK